MPGSSSAAPPGRFRPPGPRAIIAPVSLRQRLGLWAVLGAALAVRVAMVLSLEKAPFFETPIVDSAAYDAWGRQIAGGDFRGKGVFFQDPLYAYFLGLFYRVFGRDLMAVRLFQAALGTFGLWMLFEAARRRLGYRAGMTALVLASFTKILVFFDGMLLKDFLGVIAVEAALLFWSSESRGRWAAFGAALGIGSLVRGNMLLLVAAAAAYFAARREGKAAGLTLAGAAAVLLPVALRNAVVGGEFALTTAHAGINLYIGNNPENTTGRYRPPSFLRVADPEHEAADFRAEAERRLGRPLGAAEADRYWLGEALRHIGRNPATFLAVTGKRLLMLLNDYEIPDDHNPYFLARFSWVLRIPMFTFGLFTAPLAAAGIVLGLQERRRFGLLHLLAAAYGLSIAVFFIFGRYRLPVLPILFLPAAFAVDAFVRLRGWEPCRLPRAAVAAFLGTALLANLPLPASIGGHRDFRAAHYNLGVYYFRRDRPAEAAREFEAAARLNPEYLKDPAFVWTLGRACERAGREEDAFEHYDRASLLDRESPEPPFRAGRIYLRRGMASRAAERFAEAVRRDPRFADGHLLLAEAYLGMKRPDDALWALQGGEQARPDDWTLPLRRAEILLGQDRPREALEAACRVLSLNPGQPAALRIVEQAGRAGRAP